MARQQFIKMTWAGSSYRVEQRISQLVIAQFLRAPAEESHRSSLIVPPSIAIARWWSSPASGAPFGARPSRFDHGGELHARRNRSAHARRRERDSAIRTLLTAGPRHLSRGPA